MRNTTTRVLEEKYQRVYKLQNEALNAPAAPAGQPAAAAPAATTATPAAPAAPAAPTGAATTATPAQPANKQATPVKSRYIWALARGTFQNQIFEGAGRDEGEYREATSTFYSPSFLKSYGWGVLGAAKGWRRANVYSQPTDSNLVAFYEVPEGTKPSAEMPVFIVYLSVDN